MGKDRRERLGGVQGQTLKSGNQTKKKKNTLDTIYGGLCRPERWCHGENADLSWPVLWILLVCDLLVMRSYPLPTELEHIFQMSQGLVEDSLVWCGLSHKVSCVGILTVSMAM